MPKRKDINSILIIGAGPIVIGQACESIDYYLSHEMNETMNKYNNVKQGNN